MRVAAQTVVSIPVTADPVSASPPEAGPLISTTTPAQDNSVQALTAENDPSAAPNMVADVVSRVLAMVGLSSVAGDSPGVPAESPLLLAMLGWARKESQQSSAGEQTLAARTAATTTSETFDEAGDPGLAAFASLAVPNTAPEVIETTVGTPNSSTGVVTGTVTATDQDSDALTYALSGAQPSGGSVTVNANGTFTFTPTAAARFAAAKTAGADTNSFTVAVSDSQTTTTTTVTVPLSPGDLTLASPLGGLGVTPSGVAVVGNRAYVANQGSASVVVYDMSGPTAALVKTITVGSGPTGVVVSPDQTKVYVTNAWSNTVSVIDTTTNTVTGTIGVGQGPWALGISPDGTRLYVANLTSYNVSVINTATRTVIASVPVGTYPNGVAVSPDGTRVYVTNQYSYTVSVINAATNTVIANVPVGVTPSAVAVGATRAVVTNQGGNSVSIINTTTATPTVITTITLPAGAAPTSVLLTKDGTVAYVANSNDTVAVIDMTAASPTVVRTVQTDSAPEAGTQTLALSADGTRIYVNDSTSRVLRALSYSGTLQPATVTSGVNATTTSITGGIEAANMGAPTGEVTNIGADLGDLVQYQPGYWNPNWKTAQNGTVGVATNATSSWGIDMSVTGTRYVELSAYAQGSPYVQVFVDDQKVSDPFQPGWNPTWAQYVEDRLGRRQHWTAPGSGDVRWDRRDIWDRGRQDLDRGRRHSHRAGPHRATAIRPRRFGYGWREHGNRV